MRLVRIVFALASNGLAVITAPDLLDRHGPTLHVTAKAADGGPQIFVGVGSDLDTKDVTGGLLPLAPPAGLDWWAAKASGHGSQSIDWPIADGRYDVVVMNANGSPGALHPPIERKTE